MCGIAGFSLNKNSKINARSLAHALLTQIETRGRMSSGVAFPSSDGGINVYKDAVAGSNLPLRVMPRNTKTAILHTRYATKGSPTVNDNNHPVWSPNKTIALVHNGVIWNDYSLRQGPLMNAVMPEVDTAVIPALFEGEGIKSGTKKLAGDAAVAWLDVNDVNALNLARIESSPTVYTNLEDGSYVFASTTSLLTAALKSMSLRHGQIFAMAELEYHVVRGGVIWSHNELPEPEGFRLGLAASTRGATAGGHTTTTTTPIGQSLVPKPGPAPKSDEDIDREVDEFVAKETAATNAWDYADSLDSPMFRDDDLTPQFKAAEDGSRFFTVDHDGNMETYKDLDELETRLLYLAGRSEDNALASGMAKWINHFSDVGSFGFDGESMISWVEEPTEIAYHEDANSDGLEYIRDGVGIISLLAGR